MLKKKLGIVVIAVMIVGAIVPALIAPGLSEAAARAGVEHEQTHGLSPGCAMRQSMRSPWAGAGVRRTPPYWRRFQISVGRSVLPGMG